MAFKECKVLHVVAGGIGPIFLGASAIPDNLVMQEIHREVKQ